MQVLGKDLREGDQVYLVPESGPGEDLAIEPRPPSWRTLGEEIRLTPPASPYATRWRRFHLEGGGFAEVNAAGFYAVRRAGGEA